jgi:hypothetical protein
MRLGQLGRKLSLRPVEIVEFLATNNIQIASGSNTRIEDKHVLLVIDHFAPGQENILTEDRESDSPEQTRVEAFVEEPPVQAMQEITVTEIMPEAEKPEPAAIKEEETIVQTQLPTENAEIIKAPKIELPGLRVLGKIELAEPKKKETLPEQIVTDAESTETPVEQPKKTQRENRKPTPQKRDRNDFRPRKNPVALQREHEALEAEQKRKEELEREKERRTQNYLKKVKIVQPTKAAKLNKEQVIEMSGIEEEKPKSWLGRFIHWLTKA